MIHPFIQLLNEAPEKVFYIDPMNNVSYTRKDFASASLRMLSFLRSQRLGEGDRFAVILPNSVEFGWLYFASVFGKLNIVPLNPVLHPSEIEYILQSCQPRKVFFAPSTAANLNKTIRSNFADNLICMQLEQEKDKENSDIGLSVKTSDILNMDESPLPMRFPDNQIVSITYTSGTTRHPKGVVNYLNGMVNNAQRFIDFVGIDESNRFYAVLSMAYMGGFYNLLILPWVAGSSVVFSQTFSALTAISFWKEPIEYEVNSLWLVPTMMSVLLKVERGTYGEEFCRNHVKLVLVGTAPLSLKVRRDFESRYGIPVYENYGLSETLFVSTHSPTLPIKDSSVGKPLPKVLISIRNDQSQEVGIREEGEIFIKSPDLMAGYLNHKIGQADPRDPDEWFPTGDVGHLDEEGFLYITGRKKDIIIRGGINISPQAIENMVMEFSAIEQVAVVGIAHELYGEDIAAVVKLKEGFRLNDILSQLEEFCRERLGIFRKPSVFFGIEEFPTSTTGKIQKNKLKEMLKSRLGIR